jgi:hypothetical protein
LQLLFNELQDQTDRAISILGINFGYYPPPGLPPPTGMTSGRTLPWIRPHSETVDPAKSWTVVAPERGTNAVVYRDVVILDAYNGFHAYYNLTDHPIDGSLEPNITNRPAGDFVEPEPPVPLYDGTGTERVTLRQTQPLSLAAPHRAFRVRVSSPQ